MTTFAHAVQLASNPVTQATTANGMPTYASSGSALVSFFFVAGASRGKDCTAQFLAAVQEDTVAAIKILFWTRDVRGGAGERGTFRKLMAALESHDADLAARVLPLVAEYGRWDDGYVFQTDLLKQAWFKLVDETIACGERAKHLIKDIDEMSDEQCQLLLAGFRG